MLVTLIGLILIVLVLIWREIDARFRDHAASAKAASEEANKYLAQIAGKIGSMHNAILELWACPTCYGSGRTGAIFGYPASETKTCETCKGTGMKQANPAVKEDV